MIYTLCIAYFQPQLENWAVLLRFKEMDWGEAVLTFYRGDSDRPLEHTIAFISAFFFGSSILSFQLVFASVMSCAFILFHSLLQKLLHINNHVVFALFLTFLPFWFDSFKFESEALYLSAYLVISLFLYSLKIRGTSTRIYFKIISICIGLFISALIYPAVLFIFVLFGLAHLSSGKISNEVSAQAAIYFSLPYLLYGLYIFINHKILQSFTYLSSLLSGEIAAKDPSAVIGRIYSSAYLDRPFLLLAMAFLLIVTEDLVKHKSNFFSFSFYKILLILPFFGLIYAQNMYFLSDSRRITFPISVAFALIMCVRVLSKYNSKVIQRKILDYSLIPLVLFISINCYNSAKPANLQNVVISKVLTKVSEYPQVSTVLVEDSTGLLGDMFTFGVPDTLDTALKVKGANWNTDFCINLTKKGNRPKFAEVNAGLQVSSCSEIKKTYDLKIAISSDQSGLLQANPS